MLYILVSELENEELKAKAEERLNGANVFHLLLQTKCPETEVEEYLISLENYNKLSWTHLCECLVIHAIALNYSQLNGVELMKYLSMVNRCLKKIDNTRGYYVVKSMNFNHNDPFFYPTTYLINALSALVLMQQENE